MNVVEPIRDVSAINAIKKLMIADGEYMYYLLFTLGINTGLRISDILLLKYEDILDSRGRIKQSFSITEIKTGKQRKVTVNKSVHKAMEDMLQHTNIRSGYIFAKRDMSVSRSTVWRILNKYAKEAGLRQK